MTREKEYISMRQVSDLTGISACVLKRMCLRGEIDSIKKTKPTSTYYRINKGEIPKIIEIYPRYKRNYIDHLS